MKNLASSKLPYMLCGWTNKSCKCSNLHQVSVLISWGKSWPTLTKCSHKFAEASYPAHFGAAKKESWKDIIHILMWTLSHQYKHTVKEGSQSVYAQAWKQNLNISEQFGMRSLALKDLQTRCFHSIPPGYRREARRDASHLLETWSVRGFLADSLLRAVIFYKLKEQWI